MDGIKVENKRGIVGRNWINVVRRGGGEEIKGWMGVR